VSAGRSGTTKQEKKEEKKRDRLREKTHSGTKAGERKKGKNRRKIVFREGAEQDA